MHHCVIGVLGGSGGLGTSTLAVAIAVRAARRGGVTACVDADFGAGGVDVTAGLEHLSGLRWPDLAAARGDLDGAALLHSLPGDGALRVLAARGEAPAADVVRAAVGALGDVCAVTVLDLGRDLTSASDCSHVLLVAGTSARQLADAAAVAPRLASRVSSAHLVLRMPRHSTLSPEDVAVHLDLPLGAVLPDDARTATDADRGLVPGSRASGPLAGVSDQVLAFAGWPGPAAGRRRARR